MFLIFIITTCNYTEIFELTLKMDPEQMSITIIENTQTEMQTTKDKINYQARIMHQNQFSEAKKYMANKDVYEIFKVSNFRSILLNLKFYAKL